MGESEGVTAWPRAPDTGCHLEINQQPGPEPTNQKLLLHLHNSCPFQIWKSLSNVFFISDSFVILSMSLLYEFFNISSYDGPYHIT